MPFEEVVKGSEEVFRKIEVGQIYEYTGNPPFRTVQVCDVFFEPHSGVAVPLCYYDRVLVLEKGQDFVTFFNITQNGKMKFTKVGITFNYLRDMILVV